MLCDSSAVSCQHDGFLHACCLQCCDCIRGLFLHNIRDQDKARVDSVYRHMNDGTDSGVLLVAQPQPLHQLRVARCHLNTVHHCRHAVTADLLNVCHLRLIRLLPIGFLQAL